jgi:hypothetical protein
MSSWPYNRGKLVTLNVNSKSFTLQLPAANPALLPYAPLACALPSALVQLPPALVRFAMLTTLHHWD